MKQLVIPLFAWTAISHNCIAQLNENFSSTTGTSLPMGWTQNGTTSDTVGWITGDHVTLSSPDFYLPLHTRCVAVNDDRYPGADNDNSLLVSPAFSIPASMAHPYLYFDYYFRKASSHYASDTIESATVELSADGGTTWAVLDSLPATDVFSWSPRFIDLAGHSGSGIRLGFRYSDRGGHIKGWAMDNIRVYDAGMPDVGLTSLTPVAGSTTAFRHAGDTVGLYAEAFNYGYAPTHVTKGVVYGGTVLMTPAIYTIPPRSSMLITALPGALLPLATGSYAAKFWIHDTADNITGNDTMATVFSVVDSFPHKQVFFEEATGTWCG